MRLSNLLFKYRKNIHLSINMNILKYLDKNSILIFEDEGIKKILSTNVFEERIGSKSILVRIDEEYNMISSSCACLENYRKGECIHAILLFAKALSIIDNEYYNKELLRFEKLKEIESHVEIMNSLAKNINTVNSYFGLIHLTPIIEDYYGQYRLSIKIGYDKEYVVKSISSLIHAVENSKEIEYGQKLSFVHSYECFDVVSKAFYDFLANIAYDADKYVDIRKSQVLKILEIYQEELIYFTHDVDIKPTLRKIVRTHDSKLILDASKLYIKTPNDSTNLICGVNHAYSYDDNFIYCYKYKSRLENKIYETLYKIKNGLYINVNSNDFIGNLLPIIKNSIEIKDEFYNRYPLPKIKIDSYFSYNNNNIYLDYNVLCNKDDLNSPYIKQILEIYYKAIEAYYFFKNKDGKYNICNIENQYKFLTSDFSNLKSFGDVYFDESIKKIKTKKSSRTSVSVSYNVGLLDFKFENATLTLEEISEMLKAYHKKQKFIKLKDDTIIEIDDNDVKELNDFLEDFNINNLYDTQKPLNYILKMVEAKDNNLSYDDKIYDIIKTILEYKNSNYEPSKEFKNSLREYQLEGFKWLKTLASFGFGGILADDMGLGKTLQILSFIESDEVNKPSIIVCPTSLVYNWENECYKWPFTSKVKIILGSYESRCEIINNINENEKCLYITSYDSLRRDVDNYKNKFRFIIADEAQFIKNQNALKSEAIKSLKSDMRYALTGTPIENGLADLWSIFDYLMPDYLSNYHHFKSRYESLIMHNDDEALDMLKLRVTPFILRRTKKDVLEDLPDKIEDVYYCKMSSKQEEIYKAYQERLKKDILAGGNNILGLLTRLRQICITPSLLYEEEFENTKIDMAIDLIRSSISANHRILLFSQFAQSFPLITKRLESEGIKYYTLDGSTKSRDRINMVNSFNEDPSIKVFIISLKAGGTGLNLVGADMVLHLDPWWNSSAELQATDRAHRIGQTKNVYVIKLICKDTIEEKVLKLQEAKKELAYSIINSDASSGIKITKDDILKILD